MIDETGYGEETPKPKIGIRTAVMTSLSISEFHPKGPRNRMKNLGWLLRYGMQNGMCSRKKVRRIVNVPQLVDQWIEAIVGMCLAHDKDTYDHHDRKADQLLGPLLTAPVKQIREFYHALCEKMRSDERVPMLVWMGFEAWGEVIVKNAPDEGIKRLKNKLAAEISELVEEDAKEQLPKAIQRALRWRPPEVLQEIKEELEKPGRKKPKLVGRESCLFLQVGKKEVML